MIRPTPIILGGLSGSRQPLPFHHTVGGLPCHCNIAHTYGQKRSSRDSFLSSAGIWPFTSIITTAHEVILLSVKAETGLNLDRFFDQWLYKPGHPVFDVGHAWDKARKAIRLRVRQVQDFSRGIQVFKVPVGIGIVTSRGSDHARQFEEPRARSLFQRNVPVRCRLCRAGSRARSYGRNRRPVGGAVPQGCRKTSSRRNVIRSSRLRDDKFLLIGASTVRRDAPYARQSAIDVSPIP